MVRQKIDFEQKHEICQYKKSNPLVKQSEIIKIFSEKYNRKLSKSSISEILSNSELYLVKYDNKNKYRNRKAAHPELEQCLHIWFLEQRRLFVPVSDEMLIEKAKRFGEAFFGLEMIFNYI
jgi:hypothetical protein